jgi:hypothetical protein
MHCDLKPGNILLECRGAALTPKVVDFGLAVVDRRDDRDALTAEGRFAGTPAYMAPEQVRGAKLSGACDVHAMAQIMWELLMGRPAFRTGSRNVAALAYEKISQTHGLRLHDAPLGVSAPLGDLIERCTHPDPDRRPSAREAWESLQSVDLPQPPIVLAPVNMGFDQATENGLPPGWFDSVGFVKGVSSSYRVSLEPNTTATGSCVRIAHAAAGDGQFGSLMQRCPAQYLAGKAVRFQGRLCSQGVKKRTGLWLRADGAGDGQTLFFDNMHDRPIRGSTPWAGYAIEATIPPGTTWLNYGILLVGPGSVCGDDLRLLVQVADGSWIPLTLWEEEADPASEEARAVGPYDHLT